MSVLAVGDGSPNLHSELNTLAGSVKEVRHDALGSQLATWMYMMSRSYRQPFMAITGSPSAKQDKIHAHRGERRLQNRATKAAACGGFEDFLLPHKFEAYWNNTYKWGRDGRQRYFPPPHRTGFGDFIRARDWQEYTQWYRKLRRK